MMLSMIVRVRNQLPELGPKIVRNRSRLAQLIVSHDSVKAE